MKKRHKSPSFLKRMSQKTLPARLGVQRGF
jgi:hypothetical protein